MTRRERALREAAQAMLDALEGLAAWDDDLGSRSVSEAVWTARDDLREALEHVTLTPRLTFPPFTP